MRITFWPRISYPLVGHCQRPTRPHLAIDILTVLASSAECEMMFNELGDLLEARRMKMKPQLISDIQYSEAWLKKPWAKQLAVDQVKVQRPMMITSANYLD
jgi:hAT family C-terminal dimerisation region